MTRRRLGLYAAFYAPGLMLLLAVGYPIAYAIWTSFTNLNLVTNTDAFVGLHNYQRALGDPTFWQAVRVTLTFAIGSIAVEFVLGLGLALLLNREMRFRGLIRTYILVPMFFAPVVVAIVWRFMLDPEFGIVNWILSVFRIPPQTWLGSGQLALPSLIAIDVWQQTGMVFVILLAGLQMIPKDYLEAASIDGAEGWTRFWTITWPLLRPAIVAALIYRTMFALRAFDIIWVTTSGGPGSATQTLSVYMYQIGFNQFNLGYANAISLLLLVLIVFFAVIYLVVLKPEPS
jgi:multiple sugar transport system permease protein